MAHTVDCHNCYKEYGQFEKKDIPKTFVCPHCKVGQSVCVPSVVGFTKGRDYPEGYYPGAMKW